MSITAMKQAIGALVYYGWHTDDCDTLECDCGYDNAITSLRQAIEQADEPVIGTKTWFEDGKVVTQELKHSEVYKQPADELVIDKSAAIRIATALGWEPKREWVGLTDTEIKRIGKLDWDSNYVGLWYDFAKAIEAKLKEKNT